MINNIVKLKLIRKVNWLSAYYKIGDIIEYKPYEYEWQGMNEKERRGKGIFVFCFGHGSFEVLQEGIEVEIFKEILIKKFMQIIISTTKKLIIKLIIKHINPWGQRIKEFHSLHDERSIDLIKTLNEMLFKQIGIKTNLEYIYKGNIFNEKLNKIKIFLWVKKPIVFLFDGKAKLLGITQCTKEETEEYIKYNKKVTALINELTFNETYKDIACNEVIEQVNELTYELQKQHNERIEPIKKPLESKYICSPNDGGLGDDIPPKNVGTPVWSKNEKYK